MERLLKTKSAVFIPGAPFLHKTSYFGVHFGTKSGPRNYKKHTKKKRNANFYKKGAQKDTKITQKWLPESTPGAPKWCPSG